MNTQHIKRAVVNFVALIIASVFIGLSFGSPVLSPLGTASAGPANARCIGDPTCPCDKGPPTGPNRCQSAGKGIMGCFCTESNNGFTTSGTCVASGICSANSTEGQQGMPMLPMMMPPMPMDMPMMPMDCSSGFGGTSGIDTTGMGTTSTSTQACPNAYTPQNSDYFSNTPNFDFTPSSSTNMSDLFGDLNGPTGTYAPSKFAVASSAGTPTTFVGGQVFGITGGVSGDLRIFGTAITAFVSNRDAQNNTQVSGFYGSDAATQAAAVQVVATMCKMRPWATNFLSFIVPPTFFDSICTLRGFPVGQPKPKPVVTTATPKTTTATPIKPYVAPKIDVWAVPDSVRSGFRTSIFWDARGVESCVVASADGAFSQTSLSGHAPSQPLTAATTFTMTCQTATSTPVIDTVTVGIVS